VVFYILKLRRRPSRCVRPLWQRILRDKEATTLFSQLKRILSLLLQLVLFALLLLALGDPRTAVGANEGRTSSCSSTRAPACKPSIQASPSQGPDPDAPPERTSRLDEAKRRVTDLIRGLARATACSSPRWMPPSRLYAR